MKAHAPFSLLTILLAAAAFADMATLTADRDNSIFSNDGGLSNGAGGHLFTGKTLAKPGGGLRRALVHFDVAATIPAGSAINSATITLRMNRTRAGTFSCALHRLLSDWGEGTSNAPGAEGKGTAAAADDATWTHRFFNTTMWTTNGGDFNASLSARVSVGGTASYDWTSPQLAIDVQDMLDNAGTNFGWILITDETVKSAKRFDSRESPIAANRPKLTIEFTPPPPADFTVATTTPAQATLDVASDTNVTVTFSDPVDASTISPSTYKVRGSQTGFKAGTLSTGTFTPTGDFFPGEEVQVMLNGGIESGSGTALTPHLSQFTVEAFGSENFLLSPVQSLGSRDSFEIALGDLDGDGDLDAVVANNAAGNTVWTNDGSGVFTDSGQSLGSAASLNVALGDLDDDGDLDALIGNDGAANTVWINDGSGVFTDSGQALGTGRSFGVELGDLDGDGDLDAFVSNNGSAEKVWTNDGSGTFTDSGQSLGSAGSRNCALGDLDGDGDLDAFVAIPGAADQVWINDGSGSFTAGQSVGSASSFGVDLGDLDGDGDLDAFVTTVAPSDNLVWTNDGSATFSDSGQSLGNKVSRAVTLGDADGDGDLDAFVTNNAPNANEVWRNDGSGSFTDSGMAFGSGAHRDLTLGDVDGDGDLDVLLANQGDPNVVFLNFHSGETDDFDSDGIPTNAEIELSLDPADGADAGQDLDNDLRSNLEEYVADTDLRDGSSFLAITNIKSNSPITVTFEPTSTDRLYTLQSSIDLQDGSWQDVAGLADVPGTGSAMMLQDPREMVERRFYRVEVKVP